MTQREVQEEFVLRLLDVVSACDAKIQIAYEERNLALTELNEWLAKAYKEATDGNTT